MTTSGIYTVSYSRDDISTAAIRKLGVIASGQSPSPQNLIDTAQALNMLVAMFRGLGMPMWKRTAFSFTTTPTVSAYSIGTGQTFNTPYPLKLYQLYRTDSTATRIDMDIEADYTFNQLPLSSTGIPLKGSYTPGEGVGTLKLWPVPDSTAANSTFTIVYQQPFQYFINSTDTMDMPEEWYLPMVYKLASLIAPEWGIPLNDRNSLKEEAKEYLDTVLGMGGEDASLFIQPYRQRDGLQ